MSSDSSSSCGDDPSPNPKPLETQFGSVTIQESNNIVENDDAGNDEEAVNGSVNENGCREEDSDVQIQAQEDIIELEESGIRRNNSEVEVDLPSSPSSSGYAGERGSSSASSASRIGDASEDDQIQEITNDNTVLDSQTAWTPGKRHVDEDDASISWRKRKKHFFILSNSGKPIYSRYGDEHKLAGFSATLQAIISFVENGGDRVRLVRAGKHQVVFLVKGPIYLVCISCTEEPYESLRGQLELIYGQMILILTKSVNRCFEKNPKFDMTPLLGGTDVVDTYLMLLTTSSDAFYHLKDCRIRIETVLLKSNVLSEVQRSMLDGGMRVEDLPGDPLPRSGTASPHLGQYKLPTDSPERFRESYVGIGGPAGLWHFMYRSIYLDQYVSSEFSSPINSPQQQKRLYRAYQKLYTSMHDKANGPHKTQFRRDENYG
ncbi:conserved hypothetical protein [Ricinus communis]|uniref:Vacuolar fusion protein MON1 homolog n=1 Tax=Ricinus communis TaxID=3988 RepID=B9T841_RICCO|nr:conserved hypothetical protein [Ricinus communis]